MSRSRWLAGLMAAALPLAAGCNSSGQAASGAGDGAANPNHVNPLRAKTMVVNVATGHQLGPDGTIPPDQQGKNFPAGKPLFVAFRLHDAPAGANVRADWYDAQGRKLASTEKKVLPGEPAMSFTSPDTSSWPKGTYRVEIWLGDQKVDTESFSIAEPEKSAAPAAASPGGAPAGTSPGAPAGTSPGAPGGTGPGGPATA
jgi:hypothetical protein